MLRNDPDISVKQLAIQEVVNQKGATELEKLWKSHMAKNSKVVGLSALGGKRELDFGLISDNYFKTLSTDKLLEMINWSSDGARAYRVLAVERYESVAGAIRTDLETGFERIHSRWVEGVASRTSDELAQTYKKQWEEEGLTKFVQSKFTEAAMAGLAAHADPSDVHIARKYLTDDLTDARLSAVRIISKFGDQADVDGLLAISERAWGEDAALAPKAALCVAAEPESLALHLIKSNNGNGSKEGFSWLLDHDSPAIREYFRESLTDESEASRIRSVYYLSGRLERSELEGLLASYLEEATYYYNVVTWLDRLRLL